MRLIFIGDVVGKPGREGLASAMPELRAERMPDLVVANGENAAGGVGITADTAKAIFEAGVDVITLGNHTYRHREVYPYLDSERRIIRPANFPAANPGRGHTIVEASGMRVAVINLSGQMHLQVERNPFPAIDEVLESLAGPPSSRSTARSPRLPASTTCWSTCTPRRRARRSRWAGSSTAA